MLSSQQLCWERHSLLEQVNSEEVIMYIWIASWCDDVVKKLKEKLFLLSFRNTPESLGEPRERGLGTPLYQVYREENSKKLWKHSPAAFVLPAQFVLLNFHL